MSFSPAEIPDRLGKSRKLREIASKVRCMPPPSSRDPEAFHVSRSDLARDLDLIAYELWPEAKAPSSIIDIRRPTPPNVNDLPRSPRRR